MSAKSEMYEARKRALIGTGCRIVGEPVEGVEETNFNFHPEGWFSWIPK